MRCKGCDVTLGQAPVEAVGDEDREGGAHAAAGGEDSAGIVHCQLILG